MPLRSRASFMDSKAVLIVAASGRALAASARRGGYLPLVVDYFGDADTRELAHAHALIEDGFARGMSIDALDRSIAAVTAGARPCGVVCGTGFEDRTELLARLARCWRAWGNDADTVARLKDPIAFASLCEHLRIPHPETTLSRPLDPSGWLAKRKGGAGGSHVKAASECAAADNIYYQRYVAGVPISLQFLGDGQRALILGSSAQWSAPTPHQAFRYGGAVRPAALTAREAGPLAQTVHRIAAAIPLLGLNSADFLVAGDGFRLLEINPRPSATLDIFEPPGGSLFALHMSACAGKLDFDAPSLPGAAATAIVYAGRDGSIPALEWPDWTADRPHMGAAIKAGEPLCTVHATAATAAEARQLVDDRLATVLAWTQARNA
jgi:predicted ATP-grasp superfamily ATP-dependent carboligase